MAAIVVALTQPLRLCPARLGPLLGPLLREAARGWRGLGGSEVPGGGGGAAGPLCWAVRSAVRSRRGSGGRRCKGLFLWKLGPRAPLKPLQEKRLILYNSELQYLLMLAL